MTASDLMPIAGQLVGDSTYLLDVGAGCGVRVDVKLLSSAWHLVDDSAHLVPPPASIPGRAGRA